MNAWPKAPKDLIGTVHLPPSVWQPEQCKLLSRLDSAIALYQRDLTFFEQHMGKGRVRFIHHGVDTHFFKPDVTKRKASPRILYSGVYLRNEPMLVRLGSGWRNLSRKRVLICSCRSIIGRVRRSRHCCGIRW